MILFLLLLELLPRSLERLRLFHRGGFLSGPWSCLHKRKLSLATAGLLMVIADHSYQVENWGKKPFYLRKFYTMKYTKMHSEQHKDWSAIQPATANQTNTQ